MTSVWPSCERVTVVVPAFNEEEFIGNILSNLNSCKKQGVVQEVIVVSDGSFDQTAAVARSLDATVIELASNRGKSQAFVVGASACERNASTILLLLDADLKSVESTQVASMIQPLICSKEMQMVVGTVQGDLTGISGQRAIRLSALQPLFLNCGVWRKKLSISGYGLEVVLQDLLKRQLIAHTEFATLRNAEAKNLGVREQVHATNHYIQYRDVLALRARSVRRKIARLPMEKRSAMRRLLLTQTRELDASKHAYYATLGHAR